MSTFRSTSAHWSALDAAAAGSPHLAARGRTVTARRRAAATLSVGLAAASAGLVLGTALSGSGAPAPAASGAALASVTSNVESAVVDVVSTLGVEDATAAGTGIVLTSAGEVLTNNHVIEGATSVRVRDVGNKRSYVARIVGVDAARDLAVLQLEGASGLRVASLRTAPLAVGDAVEAIGNAGGRGGTPGVAEGELTATARTITASDASAGTDERLTGMLETSAALVPGDSGGPLVDAAGRVVGVDTAGAGDGLFGEPASGGFAIPLGEALRVARDVEAGEAVGGVHVGATPFLGVHVTSSARVPGAIVVGTIAGSSAARVHLAAGDTITAVSGAPVRSAAALGDLLSGLHPGDRVTLSWTDPSGAPRSSSLLLGTGPAA